MSVQTGRLGRLVFCSQNARYYNNFTRNFKENIDK